MLTDSDYSKATPNRWVLAALCVASLLAACGGEEPPPADLTGSMAEAPEDDPSADDAGRLDFGAGADVKAQRSPLRETRLQSAESALLTAIPNGGPQAHLNGVFSAAFNWPVMPIHQVVLPDGRVMSYGTNLTGVRNAKLYYVLWDPAAGTGAEAFQVLDNVTRTDLFCGTQLLQPETGEVLLLGGTRKDEWQRTNYGTADITWFNPLTNVIRKDGRLMAQRRWYATVVTTAAGEQVVMGGRDTPGFNQGAHPATAVTFAPTPEAYSPVTGWRTLDTASSDEAYGANSVSWSYPRAWLAPNGHLFLLNRAGFMYDLDPAGTGVLSKFATRAKQAIDLPSAMFAPGRILALRTAAAAVVVDINGSQPVLTATAPVSQDRRYGNATLLADGKVFVNGGSSSGNTLAGAAYHSETWDPQTGAWTVGAVAAKPRLYHSTAMLLPDGSVLTGGGGAPGPVSNLNAEIYYPPYLFKQDGSGDPAARPQILSAPTWQLGWSESFSLEVSPDTVIAQVRLIRTGSVTHAFNNEQRAMTLPFTQVGNTLQLQMPAERALAPPGFYLLFVVAADGVPSVARIVKLNAAS